VIPVISAILLESFTSVRFCDRDDQAQKSVADVCIRAGIPSNALELNRLFTGETHSKFHRLVRTQSSREFREQLCAMRKRQTGTVASFDRCCPRHSFLN
jgi:hypothetical protein